jgi:hypothetical protein
MIQPPVSTHVAAIPPDIRPSYAEYGCKVNAESQDRLFELYAQTGFLYPAKLLRLASYFPFVKENWRKGLRGGELVLFSVSTQNEATGGWASLSSWRSTQRGWHSQHLVSSGGPLCSRAVLLATKAVRVHDGWDRSYQNWFRPENRFPARVFGTLTQTIGEADSQLALLGLFNAPLAFAEATSNAAIAPDTRNGKRSGLYALAERTRGRVWAQAEDLDQDDIELDGVDQLYARVGLRRYRRIWLAHLPGRDEPAGAILAYRGPLGFSFSFLENRCELLLAPFLTAPEIASVSRALLRAAAGTYRDFAPGFIPLVADDRASPYLTSAGASLVRMYCQSIWLSSGFVGWYRHVEAFYERI